MNATVLDFELLAHFPNLTDSNHNVTSPYTRRYNCIAHAASACDAWWWPVVRPGVYWPLPDYMEETVDCFTAAYASIGYKVSDDDKLRAGVEKVAVYVDDYGKPTHAARQLDDGSWTSKLGRSEDIRHMSLSALEGRHGLGSGYGKVGLIMERAVPQLPDSLS